jgi:hypothetical protein
MTLARDCEQIQKSRCVLNGAVVVLCALHALCNISLTHALYL